VARYNDGINILIHGQKNLKCCGLTRYQGKYYFPLQVDTIRQKAILFAGSMDPTKSNDMHLYEMDLKTKQCKKIIFRKGIKQLDNVNIDPNMFSPFKKGILVCANNDGLFEVKAGSLFADLVTPDEIKDPISGMLIEDERFAFLKSYGSLPNYNFENRDGNG